MRHYLNVVPIQLLHDRWVGQYAAGWAAGMSDLKRSLEGEAMENVFELYIRTTPERLWEDDTRCVALPYTGGARHGGHAGR